VRWVEKISEIGEPPKHSRYLIRDEGQHADTSEELEGTITPEQALELVRTGHWRYVDEIELS
jgi:hypothetical protein